MLSRLPQFLNLARPPAHITPVAFVWPSGEGLVNSRDGICAYARLRDDSCTEPLLAKFESFLQACSTLLILPFPPRLGCPLSSPSIGLAPPLTLPRPSPLLTPSLGPSPPHSLPRPLPSSHPPFALPLLAPSRRASTTPASARSTSSRTRLATGCSAARCRASATSSS